MFVYRIRYRGRASSHSTASEHRDIYRFLHFSWPAHIDGAYRKVLNIGARAQKTKRLQEKTFERGFSGFRMLNAWSLCDNRIRDYPSRRAKESVEKWPIGLTLKDAKSCFGDDFWVRANMSLGHVVPRTRDSCQNRLSKLGFHSSITVPSQKSH